MRCSYEQNGSGYKTTHRDDESGEDFWISGPRKDGQDTLYPGLVEIDDDVREEFWCTVREGPEKAHLTAGPRARVLRDTIEFAY